MPQDRTDAVINPLSTKEEPGGGKKVRPFEKTWITWTMGELSGTSTEEHPALAEKMIAAGKATAGKSENKKGGTK
jgi:hypothetical protein